MTRGYSNNKRVQQQQEGTATTRGYSNKKPENSSCYSKKNYLFQFSQELERNKLFIRNLPLVTDEEALRNIFVQVSAIFKLNINI